VHYALEITAAVLAAEDIADLFWIGEPVRLCAVHVVFERDEAQRVNPVTGGCLVVLFERKGGG
jgi:hypothetical protein